MARKKADPPATAPTSPPISASAPAQPGGAPPYSQLADQEAARSNPHRRRYLILQYRAMRQLSYADIARLVGVSERMVERDLQAIRKQWRDQFGAAPTFDASEAIGDALELFATVEEHMLREYAALRQDPLAAAAKALTEAVGRLQASADPKARDAAATALEAASEALATSARLATRLPREREKLLRLALDARQKRVGFLQDVGLLERHLGQVDLPSELRGLTGDKLDEALRALTPPLPADTFTSPAERSGHGPH